MISKFKTINLNDDPDNSTVSIPCTNLTLSSEELTFTSSAGSYATVGAHDGVVEGIADGHADIEVKVTSRADLVAMAVVTVAS